jgi:transcriptional regulator with XRE-family HTH domain
MNATKINTAWFRDRIAARQTSQRKIAKAMKLDPAAVSLMLRGLRNVLPHEAEQLARELGVPLNEVLENLGVDVQAGAAGRATILGWADDEGVVRMQRPAEGPRKLEAPIGMPSDTGIVVRRSEGYTDGWAYYFVPGTSVGSDAVGRLCVCQVAGKAEWHLRVVRRGSSKGAWNLVCPFGKGDTLTDVRLASAAPVLWVKTGA